MRRKLVKQGPSTLTASMPAEWVRSNKLKAGDEIILRVEKNNIMISAEEKDKSGAKISVDLSKLSDNMVGLTLSAIHKMGFEEVEVKSKKSQFSYIQNRVSKNLLGYEIVKQKSDGLIIRFVTKADFEELPVLIRRAFLVTLNMAESLMNSETESPEEILILEETNNRLTNYCERMIVKHIHKEDNAIFKYIIIWLLEKIADEYKYIINNKLVDKEDAKVCYKLIKSFYELYYRYTLHNHDYFLQELKEGIDNLTKKGSAFLPILTTLENSGGSIIGINPPAQE